MTFESDLDKAMFNKLAKCLGQRSFSSKPSWWSFSAMDARYQVTRGDVFYRFTSRLDILLVGKFFVLKWSVRPRVRAF